MKLLRHIFRKQLYVVVVLLVLAGVNDAASATRTKANNNDNLNLGSSWGGTAPGTGDIALWDTTFQKNQNLALGANVTWNEIQLTNPKFDVSITAWQHTHLEWFHWYRH